MNSVDGLLGRKIEGEVLGIFDGQLIGWACDPDNRRNAVHVALFLDGKLLNVTIANRYHQLVAAKYPDHRVRCFVFNLPKISNEDTVRLSVVAHPDRTHIGKSVNYTSLDQVERATDFSSINGHVDGVLDGYLRGWIHDSRRPFESLKLRILEGENTLDVIDADVYREDLYTAQLGDGCHGFCYKLPGYLFDGARHVIRIVENESDYVLVNGEMEIGIFVTPQISQELALLRNQFAELRARIEAIELRDCGKEMKS